MTTIIVGADGSEPSLLAIDWAADEAARRGASLHVVHVAAPWPFDLPTDPGAAQLREHLLHGGRNVVDQDSRRGRGTPARRVDGGVEGQVPGRRRGL